MFRRKPALALIGADAGSPIKNIHKNLGLFASVSAEFSYPDRWLRGGALFRPRSRRKFRA